MKKSISGILAAVMLATMVIPCFAVRVIGQVLSTDIRAYINGAEIPAYNIDGQLAVVVSDLNNYGFKTSYNNDLRRSSVIRDTAANSFTSIPSKASGLPIGTRVMDVYQSDITVELNGRAVQAFNVDNRMAIYFTSLKDYGTYWYDNNTRTSNLTLDLNYTPKPVNMMDVVKPYRSWHCTLFGTRDYVMMGGVQHFNGFVLDDYSTLPVAPTEIGFAYFNLNGQYTKLSGLLGYVDGKVKRDGWDVKVYGDDRLLFSQRFNPGDLPKEVSIDVSGVEKLEFRVDRETNCAPCAFAFAELLLTPGGNGTTSSINTAQLGNAATFVDVLSPYKSDNYKAFGTREFVTMAGTQYYNGFVLDDYTSLPIAPTEIGYAYFNLNGQYTKLSGVMGFVDGKVNRDGWDITVYGDDRILFSQRFNPGDLPEEFLFDVSGVSKLEFRVNRAKGGYTCAFSFAELKLYS